MNGNSNDIKKDIVKWVETNQPCDFNAIKYAFADLYGRCSLQKRVTELVKEGKVKASEYSRYHNRTYEGVDKK